MPPSSTPTLDTDDQAEGLAKVHRLATELAARLRYAQMVERPLPPEQVNALIDAARLLQERGEPWPHLVGEVLRKVADDLSEEETPKEPDEAGAAASWRASTVSSVPSAARAAPLQRTEPGGDAPQAAMRSMQAPFRCFRVGPA